MNLSASIYLPIILVIGAAACRKPDPPEDHRNMEASDVAYSTIGMIAGGRRADEARLAQRALSDRFLSKEEYDDILAYSDATQKAEAIARWSTQGTETGTGKTEGLDPQDDGPVSAGDAP